MRIPTLRRHKGRSLGVVTLSGRDVYLGSWPDDQESPPPAVREAYDRAVAEWLAAGRTVARPAQADDAPKGITVDDLLSRFWTHVQQHYRHANGEPTSEVDSFRLSLRPLRHLYASLPVTDFTPLKLKAVRALLLDGYIHPKYGAQPSLSRKVVNQRVGRIVRAFRWGVGEELVPTAIHQALKAVPGLQANRTTARECDPVTPVDVGDVEKTIPHLTHQVAGLVRLQLACGCRPGEAAKIRLAEIDRSGPVWTWRPRHHKTLWRGRSRVIPLGPKAQAVLCEFIRIQCPRCGVVGRPPRIGSRDLALCGPCADRADDAGVCGPWRRVEVQNPDHFIFSPADAVEERREDRRAARKSKVQPSQVDRRKRSPNRKAGRCYPIAAYGEAVERAAERAGVGHWTPNQLRHTHATLVRERYGVEAASVLLGHAALSTTEIYAERSQALAERIAKEIG